MGGATRKQFLTLHDIPLLVYSLRIFQQIETIRDVILVVPESEQAYCQSQIVAPFGLSKINKIVAGGPRRQDSVNNGLQAISDIPDLVLVHDGVRPFIRQNVVERVIHRAQEVGAAVVAVPVHDTVKRIDEKNFIQESVERKGLWQIQTPQIFQYDWLMKAHQQAQKMNWDVTDDATLVERMGYPVAVVEGSAMNLKITKPEDLALGETFAKEFFPLPAQS